MLIISNHEMEDIIKIAKYPEESGLLLKGVTETVQNEVQERKGGFLNMLLGTLGARLLGHILTEQGINRSWKGRRINGAGEGAIATSKGRGMVRAGYGSRLII